jgi:hypothetical protein
MADIVSSLQTTLTGLGAIVNAIDRVAQYRTRKKMEKSQRIHGQQEFIHQFSYAGAPNDNAAEEETIRSYCKKLQNIVRTHWGFIFGRGTYNAEAAHAFMASTLFHVAAMPGLPPAPVAQSTVAGYNNRHIAKY